MRLEMTMEEAGKLPPYLREKEQQLVDAREKLRVACIDAVRAGERLKEVLQYAKALLDEENEQGPAS